MGVKLKMIVYFHVDELHRDAVVASALKRRLAKRGHTLVYGTRILARLLPMFHRAFDVIVMPRPHFFYDNWGAAWMEWDCRFVTLSTENLGIICKDTRVMARALLENTYFEGQREYAERIDAFCVWGCRQKQAIMQHAPDLAHKFNVVGHPRHDALCVGRPSTDRKREVNNRRVGVVTRAVALNDYFGRTALDSLSVLLNEHFTYEYLDKATGRGVKSTRTGAMPAENLMAQVLDAKTAILAMAALQAEGVELSLRIHPKERIEVWRRVLEGNGIKAEISPSELPITEWLKTLDCVIGAPSTSFYDALMIGVIPIDISTIDARRRTLTGELWEDNNRLMPHLPHASSYSELKDFAMFGATLNEPAVMSVLKDEADFPDCGNSLEKFIDVCEAIAPSSRANRFTLLGFRVARVLFEVMWKLRSLAIKRRQNSAAFTIGGPVTTFIDNLSRDK